MVISYRFFDCFFVFRANYQVQLGVSSQNMTHLHIPWIHLFQFLTAILDCLLLNGIDKYVETKKHIPFNYEGGLAVLLYIEDKNGWAKD